MAVKIISLFALAILFATVTPALPLPGPGGGDVIPPIGDTPPPDASPAQSSGPFIESVDVTLSAKGAVDIYYDFSEKGGGFDTTNPNTHHYSTPIHLTGNAHLRAVAYYEILGASNLQEWDYTVDPLPTVVLDNPISGEVIRQGVNYPFASR